MRETGFQPWPPTLSLLTLYLPFPKRSAQHLVALRFGVESATVHLPAGKLGFAALIATVYLLLGAFYVRVRIIGHQVGARGGRRTVGPTRRCGLLLFVPPLAGAG